MSRFFTSEHVSPGHPDKIMDAIAESIVDFQLEQGYKKPRVAIDGVIKNSCVVLAGECTNPNAIPVKQIVKETLSNIGYRSDVNPDNINSDNFTLINLIDGQSEDIAFGVDREEIEGAGDIGIMFGGAINEAPDFTGWAHYLARYLSYRFYNWANADRFETFYPDQKVQVTVEYDDSGKLVGIKEVILCMSHHVSALTSGLTALAKHILVTSLSELKESLNLDIDIDNIKVQFNPTGRFTIYGPSSDSGEVGRKIVCDQYGGYFAVGGGNLNGKDATKVDRSAVYMARFAAKNIVGKSLADKCEIQVSYAIGKVEPVSICVNCFDTNRVSMEEIEAYVSENFDFRPGKIIERFNLNKEFKTRNFKYSDLGKFGHIGEHFGKETFPWETIL